MLRYFCQEIFKVLIRFQIVCFCCFRNTVDDCRTFCSVDGVNDLPVFLSNTETANRSFCRLSTYENKPAYTQDIFILIFSRNALKCSSFVIKDEDNIFYLSPKILASSASSSGQSGCSSFNSGLLRSMADLIISKDGLA